MSLVHNEQTKLSATWLNGVGIASAAVGGIAPLAAIVFGTGASNVITVAVSSVVWVSIGTALHFVARIILRRLKP